jgi:methionyl-tRNA synthetase
VAILAQPAMPDAAAKLLDMLAVDASRRNFAALGPAGCLKSGTRLPSPEAVFPRYLEEGGAAAKTGA